MSFPKGSKGTQAGSRSIGKKITGKKVTTPAPAARAKGVPKLTLPGGRKIAIKSVPGKSAVTVTLKGGRKVRVQL